MAEVTINGEVPTKGNLVLVPADPDALAVQGGDPADALHVTVKYIGDLDRWDDDARTMAQEALTAWAARLGPVKATVTKVGPLGDKGAMVLFLDAPELSAFAGTPLELHWPPVAIPIPSQEVDAGYEAGLRMGTESPVTIVMKKDGLTREQAEEYLEQVAEDNAEYAPQTQEQTDGQGQDQGQGRQEGRQVLTAAEGDDETDTNE